MIFLKTFQKFESTQAKRESSCCIIVNNKDEVLVLQRGPTAPWMPLKWNLPGGQSENGESHHQTAEREVYEETDLKLSSIKFFKKIYDEKDNYFLNVFIGKIDSQNPNIILDKHPTIESGKKIIECVDYKWVNSDTFEILEYVPYTKEILIEYFSKL